jgi:hypothetical protein
MANIRKKFKGASALYLTSESFVYRVSWLEADLVTSLDGNLDGYQKKKHVLSSPIRRRDHANACVILLQICGQDNIYLHPGIQG